MKNTAITLIKILLCGKIYVDEISKYVNLDINSIEKYLQLLNKYLIENGNSRIKKLNNSYELIYDSNEINQIFSDLYELNQREREEFLCIKLLYNGYINLEKERKELDISRTTITKDFRSLKSYLETKGIELISKNSKGIFLKENDGFFHREILCKKILKLLLHKEYLNKQRKKLLKEINTLSEEKYGSLYNQIIEKTGLRSSIFSFYAIYSMFLIENKKGKFDCVPIENQNNKDYIELLKQLKALPVCAGISDEMMKFCAITMLRVNRYEEFNPVVKKGFNDFISLLKRRFYFNSEEEKRLRKKILKLYIYAYLNKKYDILWVRKSSHSNYNKIIVSEVEKILEKLKVSLYFSDILRISEAVIETIKESEYNDVKILTVSRNIDLKTAEKIAKCVKEFYPKISYEIEQYTVFNFRTKENKESYHSILTDTESYDINNLKKIGSLDFFEINSTLVRIALEKKLRNTKIIE